MIYFIKKLGLLNKEDGSILRREWIYLIKRINLFYEEDGDAENDENQETRGDDENENETDEDGKTGEIGCPDGGREIIAIKRSGGDVGNKSGGDLVSGGVAVDNASHTIQIARTIPSPTIRDGFWLADFHGLSKNVTIRVCITSAF